MSHISILRQPASRNGTTQVIAYTGSSVAATNPFGSQTYQVRLVADSACCYSIGDGAQTATTSSPFLPANTIEYVQVSPGQSIAAIRATTDGLVTATSGTLCVTELTQHDRELQPVTFWRPWWQNSEYWRGGNGKRTGVPRCTGFVYATEWPIDDLDDTLQELGGGDA